jgi:hypothetical protein
MGNLSEAKSRVGRPLSINIAPDDAKLLREAVKLASRYYGIRLQDLGASSWITAAMRKKAAMSIDTALALLEFISHPPPALVGKKRPQGTSIPSVVQQLKQSLDQNGVGLQLQPDDLERLKGDIAAQYYAYANFAGLLMQKYQLPLPGTAVFVMPGTARLAAAKLAELLPLDHLGRQRKRDIVETLEFYFELGEKPLESELGKKLIPRLTYLSLAENLRTMADIATTEGWQDDDLKRLETWAKDVMRSEGRRGRAKRWGPRGAKSQAKPAPKSK